MNEFQANSPVQAVGVQALRFEPQGCLGFMSDMHLQAASAPTYAAWRRSLAQAAADPHLQALFILGDWFEVWVGDDMAIGPQALPFEADCLAQVQNFTRQKPLYFLHGNRDFLLGEAFAKASGAVLLADPCVLQWGEQRFLLSHGDALCLDDEPYQHFRAQVRSPAWQAAFLAQSLSQRLDLARQMRAQSQARQWQEPLGQNAAAWADVDAQEATRWLQAHQAQGLIHGHTHRPGCYALPQGLWRRVLSDWNWEASVPRGELLRWGAVSENRS